ncbi:histidine kinase dimerization/phospho-acceptor domain-containing protein [Streptomyces sp. NPDC002205]|uniref:histidine kinase dimerization/phospho-acceptor domain-containing protein n=1 Tax=Streptomyces sp. NPDC002205 TaxID=3154411 RepID=UPI003322A32E
MLAPTSRQRTAANVSHQLRTSLTGLQLILEAGLAQDDEARLRPAAEALATTCRLHGTVEEVLRLFRSRGLPGPPAADTGLPCLRETEERWHGLLARDG